MFTIKVLKKLWSVRKYRYLGIAGGILLILAIASLSGGAKESIETWVKPSTKPLVVNLVESGEIRAVKAEYVKAPEEWRMDIQIVEMVKEGTMVKEGDFLVRFDSNTLEEEMLTDLDNLKQAEADLRSIDTEQASTMSGLESNLVASKYTLEAARLTVEMMKYESKNKQEEAAIDLKKEQIRYDEAVKKIETQKIINATERQKVALRLQHEQNDVQETKNRIARMTLYAPISGMVVYQQIGGRGPDSPRYKVAIGEKVDSGAAVISIPDLSSMRMVLKVNELDADKVAPGQKVEIRLDAFEDKVFHGTVSDVSSMVEKESQYWQAQAKAPSIEVIIKIDETDELLKPGMTAQANIILDELSDVVSLPLGAVFEREDGSTVVFPKKGYPKPVPVTLGKRNSTTVVIENGVSPNEEYATVPPTASAHELGWFAEMERRRTEFAELVGHIETMDEKGIKYKPAPKDSLAAGRPVSVKPSGGSSEGEGSVVIVSPR